MKFRKMKNALLVVAAVIIVAAFVFAVVQRARDKAGRIACVKHLKTIGLQLQTSKATFQSVPHCPAQTNIAYEIIGVAAENDPSAVLARCPFHNNVLLGDGSVQQMPPGRR